MWRVLLQRQPNGSPGVNAHIAGERILPELWVNQHDMHETRNEQRKRGISIGGDGRRFALSFAECFVILTQQLCIPASAGAGFGL